MFDLLSAHRTLLLSLISSIYFFLFYCISCWFGPIAYVHIQRAGGSFLSLAFDLSFSIISLATKCAMPSFRMHLRAHGMVAMVFKTLDDAQKNQVESHCSMFRGSVNNNYCGVSFQAPKYFHVIANLNLHGITCG